MRNMHLLMALALLTGCTEVSAPADEHAAETARGPHGGRLLSDGGLQIEVAIFESGVPPEFHVYAYRDGRALPPGEVQLQIELRRFGGRVDRFAFQPQQDFLRGNAVVEEPHSFDVTVNATQGGQAHRWNYESYEGRTRIAPAMATASGIETTAAAPGVLRSTLSLYGSIRPDAERTRQISARFPGLIRSVSVTVGARVGAGDTLAVIESNESLQTYALTAPIAGVITERNANPGENTAGGPLFVITDPGSVWADLRVFPGDRGRLSSGQPVIIAASAGGARREGRIALAGLPQADQSLIARVRLENRDGLWTPGQFVLGEVVTGQRAVTVAVPLAAIQTFRDWDVVFLNEGDAYQAMPVQLGDNDGVNVEVRSGLSAGQRYVTRNSYLIKADIEKSGASHDH